MKLTEINDIILGNVELPKARNLGTLPDMTEDIKDMIVKCDGLYNKAHLQQTMSYIEFYEANPMMDAFISDALNGKDSKFFKKELFYSMLCGLYVPGIPTELTAIFVLTRRDVETPNRMIAALDKVILKKYISKQFHEDASIMKKLLDLVWGYDVQLVTDIRPVVTNKGVVEVYIENINDILLCSESIRDILTDVRDFKDLWYSKEKGIVIGEKEIPVRTLIHSFGITDDDLDLRRVFSAK